MKHFEFMASCFMVEGMVCAGVVLCAHEKNFHSATVGQSAL
jgi:hypothetical protein